MARRYSDDRYQMEEDPVELGDLLEPYDSAPQNTQESSYDERYYQDSYNNSDYDDYDEMYPEDQEEEAQTKLKVAMGVFDTVSVLVGILVIMALTAILLTLIHWLKSDILHSVLLLQSGLQ